MIKDNLIKANLKVLLSIKKIIIKIRENRKKKDNFN